MKARVAQPRREVRSPISRLLLLSCSCCALPPLSLQACTARRDEFYSAPSQRLLYQITGSFLMNKLAKKGYLYLVYNVHGVGHAVVVYGIVNEPGSETIYAMDPWMGRGYTYDSLPDYKRDSHEFVVGWPLY